MATPSERFEHAAPASVTPIRATSVPAIGDRSEAGRDDGYWVARRASAVGAVCVNWQQVCLGAAAAGRNIDVWVTDQVLQFYDGDHLLRTEKRTQQGQVRKKRASIPGGRRTLKTSVTEQPK